MAYLLVSEIVERKAQKRTAGHRVGHLKAGEKRIVYESLHLSPCEKS